MAQGKPSSQNGNGLLLPSTGVVLDGLVNDDAMPQMNYQMDGAHRPVRNVAEHFLRDSGLSYSASGDCRGRLEPFLEKWMCSRTYSYPPVR